MWDHTFPLLLPMILLPLYTVSGGGSGRGLGSWSYSLASPPPSHLLVSPPDGTFPARLWAQRKQYRLLHPPLGTLGPQMTSKLAHFGDNSQTFLENLETLILETPHTL